MVATLGIIINLLLFFALGFWPIYLLSSSGNRLATSIAIAPTMGFAITSLVASYLILLDHPVRTWAATYVLISIFLTSIVCLYFFFKKRLTSNKLSLSRSGIVWLISGFVLTTIMVTLPMTLGKTNFTTFRGNGGDAFNYMTLAGYLDREAYSWKNIATLSELMDKDLSYPIAVSLLNTRWTTSAMLAYTSRIASLPIYQFEYSYTLLFFIMSFGPGYIIGRRLKLNWGFAFLTALVIGVGFWAQLVLDIRAFSQINTIPLVLSISYFLIKIVDSSSSRSFKEPVLMGILAVSLLFSYVEIVPLCVLSGVLFLVLINKTKAHWLNSIKSLGVTLIVISVLGAPLYTILSKFLFSQINSAASISNDWYKFYFPWLYSNPIIGFWGLTPFTYFSYATGASCFGKFVEFLLMGIGSLLFLVVVVSIIEVLIRRNLNTPLVYVVSFVCAAGVEFLFLYTRGQLWAAGKALAFGYPFFILLVTCIGLETNRFLITPIIYRSFKFTVTLWIALQLSLGLARNYVAITGIEYVNYMINHGYYRYYNYDLSPLNAIFADKQGVTIWSAISDEWLTEYVNLGFGTNNHVINVLGVYDRSNTILGYQQLNARPNYILIDRSTLSYNTKWRSKFKLIAKTSGFVLLEVIKPDFVFLVITNPNGLEHWNGKAGFWIGAGQTILNIISSGNDQVVFTANFIPGPSILDQKLRKLGITDNGSGTIQVYNIGQEQKGFFFPVQRGNNKIILNALDLPTIPILPNGDQRNLLLGVTNIHIQSVK